MFYLSPVLYGTHAVPDFLRVILVFNPLNGILSLYRGGLFARSVSWVDVGISAGMSVALFVDRVLDLLAARAHRPEGDLSR